MLTVLTTGTLAADPKEQQATPRRFATALMRCPDEVSGVLLVSVTAFERDAADALLALSRGDCLTVAGRATLSKVEGRQGLSVVADQVLTPYGIRKRRAGLATAAKGMGGNLGAPA